MRVFAICLGICLMALATPSRLAAQAPAGMFSEGVHYQAIPAEPAGEGQVLVFLSMACFSCHQELARLVQFMAANPDIRVVTVPLTWGYSKSRDLDYDQYAEAEIIASLLGGDWRERAWGRLRENDAPKLKSRDDVRRLFLDLMCPPEEFDRAARSFGLQTRMNQARALGQRFSVTRAPTYVVNGRFVVTDVRSDGRYRPANDEQIRIVRQLLGR